MSSPSEIKSIYFAALEKKAATVRADYLDRACGADIELRERIERLLAANPLAEDVPYRTPADRPELDPTDTGLNLTAIARSIAPAGDDVTYGFEPVRPGQVLETLARSIGPIPRVLLDWAACPSSKATTPGPWRCTEKGTSWARGGRTGRERRCNGSHKPSANWPSRRGFRPSSGERTGHETSPSA
jgi:hypothetical protein